eukprot:jgi/Mesen1/7723/ME000407S06940
MGNESSKSGRSSSRRSPTSAQYPGQRFPVSSPPPRMPSSLQAGGSAGSLTQRFADKYGCIPDSFRTVDQVQGALRNVGLESSNLIVAIDFTKSNEWAGKHTFGGRSLHAIGAVPNPYEKAISVIGQTLTPFDDDNLIPCFGFGDVTTHDTLAFSFFPDHRPCHGFEECLTRYRQIAPCVKLAGPTSFAPVIEQGIRAVEQSGGQYHVLLIIADGQVTRSSDLPPNQLSVQEQATVDAIVAASDHALSIVMIGVGDGPWDVMEKFDDNVPERRYDNFQFVEFSKLMSSNLPEKEKEAQFALAALMEIPQQYKACQELKLLGKLTGRMPNRMALPPPATVPAPSPVMQPSPYGQQTSYPMPPGGASAGGYQAGQPPAPQESEYLCPICLTNRKNMAFQCGHQTCHECGATLRDCPICRAPIATRIKLY